jgi:hypothetical protein
MRQSGDLKSLARSDVEGAKPVACEFWRLQLSGAPALLELPTDRLRPALSSGASAASAIEFPRALSAGLRRLSERHGVTLLATLLAGWASLLSRLSGQSDLVVGAPLSDRSRPRLMRCGFASKTTRVFENCSHPSIQTLPKQASTLISLCRNFLRQSKVRAASVTIQSFRS